jgi:hypothetical protein
MSPRASMRYTRIFAGDFEPGQIGGLRALSALACRPTQVQLVESG